MKSIPFHYNILYLKYNSYYYLVNSSDKKNSVNLKDKGVSFMKYRIDLFITCKSQNGNYKICESKLTVEKIREYAIIYKLLQWYLLN